jgi:hypothetical protein
VVYVPGRSYDDVAFHDSASQKARAGSGRSSAR